MTKPSRDAAHDGAREATSSAGSSIPAAPRTIGPQAMDFWVALWTGVGALTCLVAIPLEPNMLEEGIVLHIAQRLAHGEHLYSDVLLFVGPLPFELLALLFRIFGEHVWVGRGTVVLLHAASTGIVFALARSTGLRGASHVAAALFASAPLLLFPLFSLYYYTTLALHLSLIATYAAHRGLRANSWAVVAGVAAACTVLSKQSVGALLVLALGAAFVVLASRERRLAAGLCFAGGGLATALLTLGCFALVGGVGDLLHATVVLPSQLGASFSSPYVNFWPIGSFSPAVEQNHLFYLPFFWALYDDGSGGASRVAIALTQLLYALPLLAVGATVALRLARVAIGPAVWLHLALLVAWVGNLFPRADWGHLAHVLPIAVVQLCLALAPFAARGRERDARARTPIAAPVLVGVVALASVVAAVALYRHSIPPTLGPRLPLRPVSQLAQKPSASRVVQFLRQRTQPGDEIFVARAEPLVYFATDTRNPTPFPGIIPGYRAGQEPVILEALDRVRYVVMSDVDQPSMNYYSRELPAVQAHFERFFRVVSIFTMGPVQWLTVLERDSDRGESAIDLLAQIATARPFVRGTDGSVAPAPTLPQLLATQYNRRPMAFVLGPGGGGLDFDVTIPERAVFQGSVGLRRLDDFSIRHKHPPVTSLRASLRPVDATQTTGGPTGEFARLVESPAMQGRFAGRHWTHLEADLSDYAGQRVTLRLELIASTSLPDDSIGWWGSPRVALSVEPLDSLDAPESPSRAEQGSRVSPQ